MIASAKVDCQLKFYQVEEPAADGEFHRLEPFLKLVVRCWQIVLSPVLAHARLLHRS